MRLNAAASTAVEPLLRGPAGPAVRLGVSESAAYFAVGAAVFAVVTTAAVRLPCALVLATPAAGSLSLAEIGPAMGAEVLVGAGQLRWRRDDELVTVRVVRTWSPARVRSAPAGWSAGLAELDAALDAVDIGIDPGLWRDPVTLDALALLGRGPGLTPSGDDVLAGLLLGARSFGVSTRELAATVTAAAPTLTTALSAQLLRHAIAGECVPAVTTLLAALADAPARPPAIAALLGVGHTSGAAVGRGLLLAAELALRPAGWSR